MTGRHRSPPPAIRPGWRWHTVAALAGLGILAPPVTLWAQGGAPDATARSQVSTVTRAVRTDAGPLVLPTVGASGAWEPSETTENALSRPRSVSRVPVHVPAPLSASTGQPEVLTTPPQQTVTPATPTVTPTAAETTPTAPPVEIAAATTSSATTEETTPVTTEPQMILPADTTMPEVTVP